MPSPRETPWQRRIRRLFFFVGTASTVWFVSSYIIERLKEARIKAIKERKQRDLMKNHFTSLISTISFTLYALIPTLQPQVFSSYPVEEISQALQDLSNSIPNSNSTSTSGSNLADSTNSLSVEPNTNTNTREGGDGENSLLLSDPISSHSDPSGTHHQESGRQDEHQISNHPSPDMTSSSSSTHSQQGAVGGVGTESWSSEFQRRESEINSINSTSEDDSENDGMLGSSIGQIDTEDAMSSVVSQSISLPPTDTSSPSPPSESSRSETHPSPTRSSMFQGKSKKELWRELKVQSITRTITTIYLLPMLYLLTSSQLSILARTRYMKDIQSSLPSLSLPPPEQDYEEEEGTRTPRQVDPPKKKGWLSSFSIESMGLTEFKESTSSIIPNPLNLFPKTITSYLPNFINPNMPVQPATIIQSEEILAMRQAEEEENRAQAERIFLSYSWHFLNQGWKSVGDRVEDSVEKIFGNMPLKKELTVEDWEMRFKEVRAEVEMELSLQSTIELYDFTPLLLPNSTFRSSSDRSDIPFPAHPSDHSLYLEELFNQSKEHLSSPDGRYLLEKGISTMLGNLLQSIKNDLYSSTASDDATKRLVDCLPEINKWGKNVWEGIPDSGVEAMLAIPEFEGLSALVFGDWAPR
ncbi:uncharacterized protein IL334_002804 [Kwoniella shivajii]|uniref:Peroxin-3 n=1 Tax=Kwoniella shivajii TaxID=564305 RepID=A0ABZ1CVS6_9TREE|nr:hypothetical protein IL334_002804 [Kwoniella shivajii]